jgi:hypothetical protein
VVRSALAALFSRNVWRFDVELLIEVCGELDDVRTDDVDGFARRRGVARADQGVDRQLRAEVSGVVRRGSAVRG